jgi:flagellar protein FliO/FliZ
MDYAVYFRFLLALVFVLGLIGVIAWAGRRFGLLRGAVRPRNGVRRIEVLETASVDAKRRMVLVRRDRTEHLLLLGTAGDLVIERGIPSEAAPADPAQKAAE